MKLSLSPFLTCLSRWMSADVSCRFQLISAEFWPLFSLNSFGNSGWKIAFRSEFFMEFILGKIGVSAMTWKYFSSLFFQFRILKSFVKCYVEYNLSNIDQKYNIYLLRYYCRNNVKKVIWLTKLYDMRITQIEKDIWKKSNTISQIIRKWLKKSWRHFLQTGQWSHMRIGIIIQQHRILWPLDSKLAW